MLVLPFLIVSIYLPFSQIQSRYVDVLGFLTVPLSVVSGVLSVYRLPITRNSRHLIAIIYIPILLILLVVYSYIFVSAMTGTGL